MFLCPLFKRLSLFLYQNCSGKVYRNNNIGFIDPQKKINSSGYSSWISRILKAAEDLLYLFLVHWDVMSLWVSTSVSSSSVLLGRELNVTDGYKHWHLHWLCRADRFILQFNILHQFHGRKKRLPWWNLIYRRYLWPDGWVDWAGPDQEAEGGQRRERDGDNNSRRWQTNILRTFWS